MPALRLLLAKSDEEAEVIADEIELLQTERRAQQDAMLEDAEAEIRRQGWERSQALVVGKATYNVGIVGIVAGKLAERYGCPVVMYGAEGGVARGSVRGPAGTPLYDLVREASDCLIRFGGHHAAAGLELELSRVDEFRERFVQAFSERQTSRGATEGPPSAREVLILDVEDEPMRVAKELLLLEPCGEGNRAPLIGIAGRVTTARELRGGHLRLELQRKGGDIIGGFGPRLGSRAASVPSPALAIGTLRISTFAGRTRAELLVSDVMAWDGDTVGGVGG